MKVPVEFDIVVQVLAGLHLEYLEKTYQTVPSNETKQIIHGAIGSGFIVGTIYGELDKTKTIEERFAEAMRILTERYTNA